MVIKVDVFEPEEMFQAILEKVEEVGECIVETPGAVYTLTPEAVSRLQNLSAILRTANISLLLRDRGAGCDTCVQDRSRVVYAAISSITKGKPASAVELLTNIPTRNLAQCQECETDTQEEVSNLREAVKLARLDMSDFTRTPVITSFTKYIPRQAQIDTEYDVVLPGGISFRVRWLRTPAGFYYDPILPVETLSIKERTILNNITRRLASSSKPPEEMVKDLLNEYESPVVHSILSNFVHGLGDLQYLIYDKRLTDIYIYPTGIVEVSAHDRDLKCTLRITSHGLENLAAAFRRLTGEYFYESDPLSTYFWDQHNCRLSAVGYTGNFTGKPDFAIRLWPEKPWHVLDLIDKGALDFETAAVLTVGANLGVGVILGGGRGSGKSTFLQTFLFMIPRYTRKVALMTAREIHRWFSERRFRISEMRVHTGQEVSARGVPIDRAVKQMLVHGESAYIIFNEIKYREEAVPFFTAAAAAGMSSILTTMHASNAGGIVQRLGIDYELPATALRTIRWIPVTGVVQKPGSIYKRRVFRELSEVLPFKKDPITEGKVKPLIKYDPATDGWWYAGADDTGGRLTDATVEDFVRESNFLTRAGAMRGLDTKGVAEYILLFRDFYQEVFDIQGAPPDPDTFSTYMECLFASFPEEGFTGKDRQDILRRWRLCSSKRTW